VYVLTARQASPRLAGVIGTPPNRYLARQYNTSPFLLFLFTSIHPMFGGRDPTNAEPVRAWTSPPRLSVWPPRVRRRNIPMALWSKSASVLPRGTTRPHHTTTFRRFLPVIVAQLIVSAAPSASGQSSPLRTPAILSSPLRRRKTRCNKQIPCDLCLKRGVAHMCRLESQFGAPPPA
jgi:hypothetical protein